MRTHIAASDPDGAPMAAGLSCASAGQLAIGATVGLCGMPGSTDGSRCCAWGELPQPEPQQVELDLLEGFDPTAPGELSPRARSRIGRTLPSRRASIES